MLPSTDTGTHACRRIFLVLSVLFGAWQAPARLRLKSQKRMKTYRRQVLRGFVGAELYPDKESPAGHIGVWLRALTPYGRIYTEHEMLGKHVHGFVCR